MKVAVLLQFLRSLAPALEEAGDGKAGRGVLDCANGLSPFEAMTVEDLAGFLNRASEYEATGVVRPPAPGERQAMELLESLTALQSATENVDSRQNQVRSALEAIAAQAGLKGTLKADAKWAEAHALKARLAPFLKAVDELAARITSPEAFADPVIHQELSRLESTLDAATAKALAGHHGLKATAKAVPGKILIDVIARISGHQPPKAAKGRNTPVAADPALVASHSQRLAELVSRSIDPDGVSETEVEEELTRLKPLAKPTLFEVIQKSGIEGIRSSDSASALLQRVRDRLTATRRARERAGA